MNSGTNEEASLPDLFRCAYCRGLVTASDIERDGKCPTCGARRVTGAVGVTEEEVKELRARGYVFDMTKWKYGATA